MARPGTPPGTRFGSRGAGEKLGNEVPVIFDRGLHTRRHEVRVLDATDAGGENDACRLRQCQSAHERSVTLTSGIHFWMHPQCLRRDRPWPCTASIPEGL